MKKLELELCVNDATKLIDLVKIKINQIRK